jgi:hypothetical protein
MSDRGRGAVILAHNRQELLNDTIAAIQPQVDVVLVIDNASEPKLTVPAGVFSIFIPEQPPNLARYWNVGLDVMRSWFAGQPYDVAVLCDDVAVPGDWFEAVVAGMRRTGAVAGSSSPWQGARLDLFKSGPDEDIMNRMCSWAFVMDGECTVRADPSMRWWWFDTDFDFRLRLAGGTVQVSRPTAGNRQPNYYTSVNAELGAQTGIDRQVFMEKWVGSGPAQLRKMPW